MNANVKSVSMSQRLKRGNPRSAQKLPESEVTEHASAHVLKTSMNQISKNAVSVVDVDIIPYL